jgi:hypothetical protein
VTVAHCRSAGDRPGEPAKMLLHALADRLQGRNGLATSTPRIAVLSASSDIAPGGPRRRITGAIQAERRRYTPGRASRTIGNVWLGAVAACAVFWEQHGHSPDGFFWEQHGHSPDGFHRDRVKVSRGKLMATRSRAMIADAERRFPARVRIALPARARSGQMGSSDP